MKDKTISLRALIEKYPNVFSRQNQLGERILACLNISLNDIDEKVFGFEKFHNFARFVLFYDANFQELAEFIIRVNFLISRLFMDLVY